MAVTGEPEQAERLVLAVVAVAHGHATLLEEGAFESAGDAAERAARAAQALIAGRANLIPTD